MPYQQLIFERCTQVEAEVLEALLAEHPEVLAVCLEDAADQPILEPKPGETPLWQQIEVEILLAETTPIEPLLMHIAASGNTLPPYRINRLEDQVWERVCLDQFKPITFGNALCICPSWCTPPSKSIPTLLLDPGLAFGTGTHPTTQLCLNWLAHADVKGKTVMDFGCGSGILGLSALLLGAAHLIAVDIDPQALLACEDNARKNHLHDHRLSCCYAETLPATQPDIILANILAEPLIALAPSFFNLLAPKGELVLSGILSSQCEQILQTYSTWFDMNPIVKENEWICVTGRRKTLEQLG